jgi:hypothetical protein
MVFAEPILDCGKLSLKSEIASGATFDGVF